MSNINPALNNLGPLGGAAETTAGAPSLNTPKGAAQGAEFRNALQALREDIAGKTSVSGPSNLKFSNHAVERMQMRGIQFTPEQLNKIENAVQKAAAKGAKDTLLLTDTSALIVSVKNNTVVTVLDKTNMKDNVFTNIDSTVMI